MNAPDQIKQALVGPPVAYAAHRYGRWGYFSHVEGDVAEWTRAANQQIPDQNAHWHGPVNLFDEEAIRTLGAEAEAQRNRADRLARMLEALAQATGTTSAIELRQKAADLLLDHGAQPLPAASTPGEKLSRRHMTRLRHYFSLIGRAHRTELDGLDLDLLAQGLINSNPTSYSGSIISVTDTGIQVLHRHRTSDIQNRNTHHSLGNRLAAWLRTKGRMTWENVEFTHHRVVKGESHEQIDIGYVQHVRPDVFSVVPSLKTRWLNPCIHEVKVSRADFLAELASPQKQEAYAAMAEAVYFVAPEGLIQPQEIPQGLGLVVEHQGGGFSVVKRAKKRKIELQSWHYLAMVLKRGMLPGQE